MRIDKYLKLSRIIKRREVASTACDQERIAINGKVVKSSKQVKIGDIISVEFSGKVTQYEILDIKDHVTKEDADKLYRIV